MPLTSTPMHGLAAPLRILGYVVLAAMAVALAYALYISLVNWASIAV